MKAIHGNLSIEKQYEIVEAKKSEDYCSCDNCNKPIKNIAIIKDSDNKYYNVGLDCATSLSENGGFSNYTALVEAKKEIARLTKLYSYIKKTMEKVETLEHKGKKLFNLSLKGARFADYQLNQESLQSLPKELQKLVIEKIVV